MKTVKKEENTSTMIIIGVVVFLFLFKYGGENGWFKSTINLNSSSNIFNSNQFPTPQDIVQDNDYEAKLEIEPDIVCLGDYAIGRIFSNIPNGACRIFISSNGNPWQKYKDVTLNSKGEYSESNMMNSLGTAIFVTICCDANFRCAISNQRTLRVETCEPIDKYYCCYAMGVHSCYEGGCPPAGVQLGVYNTLSECQANCGDESSEDDNSEDGGDGSSDIPVCQSSYPTPQNQDDCYQRPGCTNQVCVFVPGGVVSVNRCECMTLNSCDVYCRYQGYSSGYCSTQFSKTPCGDNVRVLGGDQYCSSFNACCCRV